MCWRKLDIVNLSTSLVEGNGTCDGGCRCDQQGNDVSPREIYLGYFLQKQDYSSILKRSISRFNWVATLFQLISFEKSINSLDFEVASMEVEMTRVGSVSAEATDALPIKTIFEISSSQFPFY